MERIPAPSDEVDKIEDNKLNPELIESEYIISRLGLIVIAEENGEITKFRLVEEFELPNAIIDDARNISVKTPVGGALLGHIRGDIVDYTVHSGKTFSVEIIDVI